MMNNYIEDGLSFDDILLEPQYSDCHPTMVDISTQLTANINLKIPLLSSAMDTVTEWELATKLAQLGGLGVIHKNMSIGDQRKQVIHVKSSKLKKGDFEKMNLLSTLDNKNRLQVGAAIGITDNAVERIDALVQAEVDLLCIDSAHGHSKKVIELVKLIRQKFPTLSIMAGNVATASGAIDLYEAGANVIKVGIGPGSICTTRIVTGVGVPQITAIQNVYKALQNEKVKIISDGGIKHSGDITKALAAGADAVMLGSAFAGVEESPGKIVEIQGYKYKEYRGMGSLGAMSAGSSDRYFQANKNPQKLVPEGVEGLVVLKGKLKDIVFQLVGGLRSGMGYCGASNISKLRNVKFIKITNAGLKESHPHQILISNNAPNYNHSIN